VSLLEVTTLMLMCCRERPTSSRLVSYSKSRRSTRDFARISLSPEWHLQLQLQLQF